MDPQSLMSPQDLADKLGLPLASIYNFNYRGTGPRRIRVGRHVRYRRADVEAWIERQYTDRPTADDAPPGTWPAARTRRNHVNGGTDTAVSAALPAAGALPVEVA